MNTFTRVICAAVMCVVFQGMVLAQLAYNVPFSAEDWDLDGAKTTVVASSGTVSWSEADGICLGDGMGGGFNWDDKYVVIALSDAGTPERLSATTKTKTVSSLTPATDVLFSVSVSADNETFEEVWSSKEKNNTVDVELPATTKFVKIMYSGNFGGCFQSLMVTGTVVESAVENVEVPTGRSCKVMMNGQIYILKDNQLYDCLGRAVME